ncbi:DUF4431 domain-containing protein [Morganella psychrotolerans]|uniref:DUF4431 domain-containing protein n=1 Tax=Morganella psychrotolerans TaxID=368603 RepID=UPI0039B0EC7A
MLKIVTAGFIFISCTAGAASFDCGKAATTAEKLVCNTPSLSQADDELYVDYLQAKLVTGNSDEFKKITRMNRKLREKNCDTVECQAQWYQRSTILFRNLAATGSNNRQVSCYNDGQQVSITGEMKRTVYPGPPNYESIEDGDEPEIYWILHTQKAMACMNNAPEWGDKDKLQLVISGDFYNENKQLLNKPVVVNGQLMYAETGHHHTPVLIVVDSVALKQ